jgi:hypothetical protein
MGFWAMTRGLRCDPDDADDEDDTLDWASAFMSTADSESAAAVLASMTINNWVFGLLSC